MYYTCHQLQANWFSHTLNCGKAFLARIISLIQIHKKILNSILKEYEVKEINVNNRLDKLLSLLVVVCIKYYQTVVTFLGSFKVLWVLHANPYLLDLNIHVTRFILIINQINLLCTRKVSQKIIFERLYLFGEKKVTLTGLQIRGK